MQWLNRIREKLETVSKTQKEMDLETKKTFKLLEEKVLNWVQPDKRKEEQRRVMGLMQRHSQFIQSYDKQIHSVKGALSKNEYQILSVVGTNKSYAYGDESDESTTKCPFFR